MSTSLSTTTSTTIEAGGTWVTPQMIARQFLLLSKKVLVEEHYRPEDRAKMFNGAKYALLLRIEGPVSTEEDGLRNPPNFIATQLRRLEIQPGDEDRFFVSGTFSSHLMFPSENGWAQMFLDLAKVEEAAGITYEQAQRMTLRPNTPFQRS